MVGLRISCIPYNGPHRPEVSYLSPTCVMQPASQRDATQHGLRSHACTQLRGQKPRTDTAVSCVFLDARRTRRRWWPSINFREKNIVWNIEFEMNWWSWYTQFERKEGIFEYFGGKVERSWINRTRIIRNIYYSFHCRIRSWKRVIF